LISKKEKKLFFSSLFWNQINYKEVKLEREKREFFLSYYLCFFLLKKNQVQIVIKEIIELKKGKNNNNNTAPRNYLDSNRKTTERELFLLLHFFQLCVTIVFKFYEFWGKRRKIFKLLPWCLYFHPLLFMCVT